jgi:hypothetical protein
MATPLQIDFYHPVPLHPKRGTGFDRRLLQWRQGGVEASTIAVQLYNTYVQVAVSGRSGSPVVSYYTVLSSANLSESLNDPSLKAEAYSYLSGVFLIHRKVRRPSTRSQNPIMAVFFCFF